jgi:hypothetical protein
LALQRTSRGGNFKKLLPIPNVRAGELNLKSTATAFRSLEGFHEGDFLPGEQRRLDARTFFTHIRSGEFNFGVITGDTGAGKSSIARSELRRLLAEDGFQVAVIRSPRSVFRPGGSRQVSATTSLKAIREWIAENFKDQAGRPVLVIDQFEEFFIEFKSDDDRVDIGRFLRRVIDERKMQIICVLRRDYFVDLRAFESVLGTSMSARNVFYVKNFEFNEAKNIILECAAKDRISISEEMAAVIAQDLSDDGAVRPAELQIVCTALRGDFNEKNYRTIGGAPSILSHHVSQAIENCREPKLARLILRTLCDFGQNAKASPRSVADLVASTLDPEQLQASRLAVLTETLERLGVERLVELAPSEDGEPKWTLIHDYIVESIKIATQDETTKNEDAERQLKAYIAEFRSNPRLILPPYLCHVSITLPPRSLSISKSSEAPLVG